MNLVFGCQVFGWLLYSSTLGVPDSVYARFDIISHTCHLAPYYLNSDKPFLTLSDQYCNPGEDSKPGLRLSVYLNLTHALNHSATTAGCSPLYF